MLTTKAVYGIIESGMDRILEDLYALKDDKYADFQFKLTPTISREKFIGVRVPILRAYAKKLNKENKALAEVFLTKLPHSTYDENMLQSLLISEEKDYDLAIKKLDEFLPYVDNWAVCDIMSPKILKKHPSELIEKIKEWVSSPLSYTIRFGIEMLMSFYLDDNFKPEYLNLVSRVKSEEYYVNMMIAWFFATALFKQWDDTIFILENKVLDKWTHNKTIQKALESYRITDKQKDYLKSLKI